MLTPDDADVWLCARCGEPVRDDDTEACLTSSTCGPCSLSGCECNNCDARREEIHAAEPLEDR